MGTPGKVTPELVLATGNAGKAREYRQLFRGLPLTLRTASELGLRLPPTEPYTSFSANAQHKALFVAKQTAYLVLAEDAGLEVDALGGKPGVRSSRYAGPEGTATDCIQKVLEELKGVPWDQRTARFRCVLVLAHCEKVLLTAEGTCEGVIAEAPQGSGGFGYDPIFYLPEFQATMAEIGEETKNRISHRARAAAQARQFLASLFGI